MAIKIINTKQELEQYIEQWDSLAERAIESNPFYESWMLLPAWEILAENKDIFVTLIFSQNDETKLIGLFPFCKEKDIPCLPITEFKLWRYPQCFLCTPLVAEEEATSCFEQFYNWSDSQKNTLIRLSNIRGDGNFYSKLKQHTAKRSIDENAFTRGIVQAHCTIEEYLKNAMSSNARHEFKKKNNKLAKLGKISEEQLTKDSDPEFWLSALLKLEHAGWKGKQGTSILSSPCLQSYYSEIFHSAFQRNRLAGQMLTLDQKPIAIIVEFLCGGDIYADKTAFDEELSKYSPGTTIFADAIKFALSSANFNFMDSCAEPTQITVNRLCTERRVISNIAIPSRGFIVKFFIFLMRFKHKYLKKKTTLNKN